MKLPITTKCSTCGKVLLHSIDDSGQTRECDKCGELLRLRTPAEVMGITQERSDEIVAKHKHDVQVAKQAAGCGLITMLFGTGAGAAFLAMLAGIWIFAAIISLICCVILVMIGLFMLVA